MVILQRTAVWRGIIFYILSKKWLLSSCNEIENIFLQCNINHINAMAWSIKETLVITGKDAKRFAEKMVNLNR